MNDEKLWGKIFSCLLRNEAQVQTPTGLWFKAYVENRVLFVTTSDKHSPACRISMPRPIMKDDFLTVASYYQGWSDDISWEKRKARDESQNTAYIIGLIMKYKEPQSVEVPEKKIIDQLMEVITEVEILEKEYRKTHSQAVDIDDIEESKKIQNQTYEKIRKLKDWKKSINHLSEEIEQHVYVFSDHQEKMEAPVEDFEEAIDIPPVDDESPKGEALFEVVDENAGVEKLPHVDDESLEDKVLFEVVDESLEVEELSDEIVSIFERDEDQQEEEVFVDLEEIPEETLEEIPEEMLENHSIEKVIEVPISENFIESTVNQSTQAVSLDLFGTPELVAGWGEVLFKFCQNLLFRRPYSSARLDQEALLNDNGVINFSYIEGEMLGDKERLSNGLWVSKENNRRNTIRLCHIILELTGYSERNFIINDG